MQLYPDKFDCSTIWMGTKRQQSCVWVKIIFFKCNWGKCVRVVLIQFIFHSFLTFTLVVFCIVLKHNYSEWKKLDKEFSFLYSPVPMYSMHVLICDYTYRKENSWETVGEAAGDLLPFQHQECGTLATQQLIKAAEGHKVSWKDYWLSSLLPGWHCHL